MNKQRKTSNILNVFQYDETTGAVTLPNTLVITAPASDDNSTKVGTTAWVRTYVSGLSYQGAITLTVTGTSGAATLVGNTLNIPTYTLAGLGGQAALSGTGFVKISGTTISYDNSTYATQTYVGTQIANLVDSSPSTLDTLNELAAALGDDPNFATTVATSIGTKQAQLNGTGFVKVTGTTVSYDNSTYLTTGTASSTYVPYTGATADLVLGANNFSAKRVSVLKSSDGFGGFTSNYLFLQTGSSTTNVGTDGISLLSKPNTRALVINYDIGGTNYGATLDASLLTSGRTYEFPNASGVLALTSNLSSYLPLSGGTLTGALNGTSASFSGAVSGTSGSFNGNVRAVDTYNLYKTGNSTLGGQLSYDSIINQLYLWNNISTGYFSIYTNSTERFTILSGGNTGIGTATPTQKLEVKGSIRLDSRSKVDTGEIDSITFTKDRPDVSTGTYEMGAIRSFTYGGYAGGLTFYSGRHTGGGNYGLIPVMTIGSTTDIGLANLGIGTTSPRTRLQVTPTSNGEVPVLGTATGVAIFTSTNTNYGLQFNSTSDGSFHIQSQRFDGSATAYNLILNYAGGNVAIGTQTAYGKLQITGAHTSGYGILNINSSNSCLISLDSSSTYDVRIRYKYQGTDQWFTGMYDDTSYKFVNAPGTTILTLAQSGTATFNVNSNSTITLAGGGTDASIIKAGSGDELYLGGNDTWQMRLSGGNILMDNGGSLGVGISSPFAKLHVRSSSNDGTIAIGHQSFPGLIFSSASSGEFRIDNRSSFNGYITFYPNGQNTTLGSEAMRITSTGAAYFTNKLTVGGTSSYTSSTLAVEGGLKVGRSIYGWFQSGTNSWDGFTYLHLKTNISAGLGGNIHYTMSLFYARLYSYTGQIKEGHIGFHNWDGAFYAPATTGNIWAGPYRSSDGFIVLVLTISSSSHVGVTVDWHQAFPYPFVDKVVTAFSGSNSTSGVY
jgi:hypothetical protein